jgi:hypothetical protein
MSKSEGDRNAPGEFESCFFLTKSFRLKIRPFVHALSSTRRHHDNTDSLIERTRADTSSFKVSKPKRRRAWTG